MRAPPPTAKGVVTIEQIVETLPDRGRSCWHLGAVWALSQVQENEVTHGRGWHPWGTGFTKWSCKPDA